jgi:23S rRNA pseudouridine1911/1915/1917 synthase
MDIPIIYEDDQLLIINKPAGITVNSADTTRNEETIQDWMEQRLGIKPPKASLAKGGNHESGIKENKKFGEEGWDPEMDFYARGGVVHRLDKETSGILILAKNPKAFVALQKQFKDRTVHKEYQALAHGEVKPGEGEISVPVGRLPWNRKSFGIVPGGRESKTLYKVLQYYVNPANKEALSLVELYPQSGRTHQIRVHLKYINHPIFSDYLYAGRKTSRNDRKQLERVFLHAAKISFIHPISNEEVHFTAPLPDELANLLSTLTNLA